jgi:hypothetical protein
VKSLAHPEWPYIGTQWEWRGFAKPFCAKENLRRVLADRSPPDPVLLKAAQDALDRMAIYQKQNFGPNLD